MHEHIEPKKCKHELKYCVKCDQVYCEKCKEEWSKQSNTNYIDEIRKKLEPPFRPYEEKWNNPLKREILCAHKESL